jgi:RHS repeat-associated protein
LVTRETRASGAATRSTGYTYDLANRLATITYPSGLVVAYSRDDMGRITAVNATNPATSLSIPVVSAISTLPFGPHSSMTYGDGALETRSYDLDYRLTNLAASWGNPLQSLSYAYDANSNVLSITDGVTPANSQTFAYNKINRLNQATGGYGGLAYTYDLVGNCLSQTTTISAVQTYSYAGGSNRLLQTTLPGSTPSHQFTYSPTGNVVQDIRSGAPYTLSYNQANRLATFGSDSSTLGAYAYDAFGQRLTKAVSAGTTLYQYDLAGHLIEESDVTAGPATVRADYIYLDDQPVGLYVPSSGMLFYHSDRLGTPQLLTDANKGIDWIGNYQPFGPVTISSSITQNLRLPGQYADAEIGWSHNGFRTYAQGLGRYVESDPIGLNGGLNTFAYAKGNPTSRIDPYGLTDYSPNWTQALLDQAYNSATDQSWGGLGGTLNIFMNSKGMGPYDFSWNEHEHDRFCVNGQWMNAGEFGNYVAGYQAGALDAQYPNLPPEGLAAVRAAGIAFHVVPGQSKTPFYDPADTTGMPFINAGYAAGYARGAGKSLNSPKCPCK